MLRLMGSILRLAFVRDCILDANWQENGIIHVLDIIRWRSTYFVDCEAEFR
jgi:snurportin-1